MDDREDFQDNEEKTLPIEESFSLSNLFFCWALPFFYKRYKKEVTDDECYRPLESHKSCKLGDKLEKIWLEELEINGKAASLKRTLWKCYRFELITHLFIFMVIEFVLKMSQPILTGELMNFYSKTNQNGTKSGGNAARDGQIYGFLLLASSFLCVLVSHSYLQSVQHLGMRIKVAVCSVIYRKSLKLTKSTLGEITVGKMINLLSNDVNRFDMFPMHFAQLCVAPFEAVIFMAVLYFTVGWTVLAGVAFLIIVLPLQMYMGKLTGRFRISTATKTDYRIKLMNEIISGIQVIKMYAWEKPFSKMVANARKLEIEQIQKACNLKAINVSLMILINRFGIFLCVIIYAVYHNRIDAKYVFEVTSFYVMLRQTLTVYLPFGINSCSETKVSVERIRNFLISDEVETAIDNKIVVYIPESGNRTGKMRKRFLEKINRTKTPGVFLKDVFAKWTNSSKTFVLSQLNFQASPGQLIMVIGEVGSGKTALLQTILKEIPITGGALEVTGVISYASQEPWLFSSSIRQNILFGQPMDEEKYQKVVDICCLNQDFDNFTYGDLSLIGEKGVMLSGGQKARVNLARAIYKNADIYLLDDPLSAVDVQVGREIFEKCIKNYLKNKCTILVTHQIQYLKETDRVYVLENGQIREGSEMELKIKDLQIPEEIKEKEEKPLPEKYLEKARKPLEIKEESKTGKISKHLYQQYLKSGGGVLALLILPILFTLTQVGISTVDYFLGLWVNLDLEGYPKLSLEFCIYFYGSVIIITLVITLLRSLIFFNFCMKSSRKLHDQMFSKIVKAPMQFFNTNPSGRILNRFSKDVGLIDEMMPTSAMDTFQIAFIALGTFLVIGIVNFWFLIPAILISIYFYCFKTVFLMSSRNLKRMEAITRSPVFSHTTASLQGLTTIRVLGARKILEKEFDHHQDKHTTAFYLFLSCNRAFAFWLDITCVAFTAAILLTEIFKDSKAGNVGLAITQAMGLTGAFQWGIRQWSELENQMTSVERVMEYAEIVPEIDCHSNAKKLPEKWPENGNIQFKSLFLRYTQTGDYTLKNISFSINSREKIGIVGRTGAGKSSLMSALFRLAPETEGEILIDGVDTKNIPLEKLRSKISIIPQDPVLFSGTLRDNLDPFHEYNDNLLWNSLEQVTLRELLAKNPEGLLAPILEGGSNLSVGQRQLICLARAILRENRILVLDEATANVDEQSDVLIQKTVRKLFKDCTVLTIAHRLNTIMDSDRILVLDNGEIAEFGPPGQLLSNSEGHLCRFVEQSDGRTAAEVS